MDDKKDICLENDFVGSSPNEKTKKKFGREIKIIPKRAPLKISKENAFKFESKFNSNIVTTNNICSDSTPTDSCVPVRFNQPSLRTRRSTSLINKLRNAQCTSKDLPKSLDSLENDNLNKVEREKCPLDSTKEFENSKKFETEFLEFLSEDISQISSLRTKLSAPNIQDKQIEFYSLVNGQSLISTNIYSGSLCTSKEYTTTSKPIDSLPSTWSLSPKIWSPSKVQTLNFNFHPPVKTARGFVKVKPTEYDSVTTNHLVKETPQIIIEPVIQSESLKSIADNVENKSKKSPQSILKDDIQTNILDKKEQKHFSAIKKHLVQKPSQIDAELSIQSEKPKSSQSVADEMEIRIEESPRITVEDNDQTKITDEKKQKKISAMEEQDRSNLRINKMEALLQKLLACTAD